MASLTNISLKRQVNTTENGSKVFGNSTTNGGFSATFKKGLDNLGGSLTLENDIIVQNNATIGSVATNNHTVRGVITFGSGTTIVINDTGNLTIGGSISGSGTGDKPVIIANDSVLQLSVRTGLSGAAGEIFVDSSDGNKLKYHDGSAFQTIQTGATLTFNAVKEKTIVATANAGRTTHTIAQVPIGLNATERNDMVKVYLNGILLEESTITNTSTVSGGGTSTLTWTITIPSGESITPYSLTFEVSDGASPTPRILRGKDDGAGGIVDNGSDAGNSITTGSVNYQTGAVSITIAAPAGGSPGPANNTFSVADYSYTDTPTRQVDVFGTIVGDKILVWYLVV